jgi:hypothetical protein
MITEINIIFDISTNQTFIAARLPITAFHCRVFFICYSILPERPASVYNLNKSAGKLVPSSPKPAISLHDTGGHGMLV